MTFVQFVVVLLFYPGDQGRDARADAEEGGRQLKRRARSLLYGYQRPRLRSQRDLLHHHRHISVGRAARHLHVELVYDGVHHACEVYVRLGHAMMTMGGALRLAGEAITCPSGAGGLVVPKPVPKSTMVLPGLAGVLKPGYRVVGPTRLLPSECSASR